MGHAVKTVPVSSPRQTVEEEHLFLVVRPSPQDIVGSSEQRRLSDSACTCHKEVRTLIANEPLQLRVAAGEHGPHGCLCYVERAAVWELELTAYDLEQDRVRCL